MKDRHTHNVHLRLDTAAEVQEALAHACREGDDVSELRDLLAAKVDRATAILTLPEPYFPTYTLCTPFGDVEVRFEESQEVSRVVRFFPPQGAPLTVNRTAPHWQEPVKAVMTGASPARAAPDRRRTAPARCARLPSAARPAPPGG